MEFKSMAHLLPENNTLGFRRRQDEEDKPWSLPGEFVRAVGTGARATAQSIAELPKIIPGIDYEVTVPEFTERPQTVGGDIAAAMVQFAVPYGVVLKGISLGSRLFGAGRAARTAAEAARAAQVASSARTAEAITTAPKVGQAAEVARKATLLDDAVVPIPLTKRQKLVKYAGAGAAADFIAFSPNDPTLGNFIQGLGGDKIPVINAISDLLATDEDDSDALNRFRHVMEGLGLGAAVPMVFKGLGKGLSLSGQAIDKVTPYAKDARGRPVYKQDVLVKTEPRKKKDGTPDLRFKQKPPQYEKRQINIIEYRRDKLVGALDKTIQNFVDKSHAVRLIDEAYEKFNPNKPHALRNGLNAWKERRMLVSIEEQQIRAYNDGFYRTGIDGVPVRYSNHKSMKEIEQNIVKVAELSPTTRQETIDLHQDYLYAVQAKQHKATKKLSGLDDEKIKNTLARVEALPSNIKTAFETSVKDLKDYNNAALRLLLDEGIIDKATFDNIGKVKVGRKLEDRLWIPMLRQGDDRAIELALASWAPTIPKGSKVSISRADLSKLSQAELREYNIENPLNQAYNNLELGYDHIIKSVAENRAKRAMYDTIIELGEQGTKWAVKSTKVVTRKDISGRGIKELLGKQGGALKDTLNDSDIFKMFSSKYDITNKTDIIYRDGKAEVWDIKDPLLMDSLQAMGPQLTKDFTRFYMRWGGKFKNFLTRMVTSSPTFFFGSNFARDTLSVGILMKGFIPFISSYRGLYHQLRNTDIAKRLEVSGGTFGNRAYTDFGTSKEFQGRNASRIHTIDGPKGLTKVVGFIDKWTSKFEMASRTEAFRLFTKQGYSDNVAAFKAREIAVDFAQSGSSANFRLATSTVPFLNASIQGLSRTLRALGGKKLTGKKLTAEEVEEVGRAWTNMMAVTTVGGVLLPMAHYTSSDESIRTTYDEIPKYLKDTNFVWVTPKIDGVNQIILLPKPFDFGIIPTIAEKFLDEEFIESDAMVVREYLRTAFLNSTRLGDASLAPQFIRPLIELKINKKFTGAPIVPRNLQGGTIAQRRFWTSPTATFFADVAGSLNFKPEWTKSPLAVEHILNSYFGTVGGFVMDYITDPVFRGMLELPDKPIEPEGRRWPWEEGALGLGKVGKVLPVQIRSDALSTTRSVNELYDAFNKAKSFKIDFDSVKNNLDGFTQKHFQEMIKDPETMFFLIQYPMLEEALSNLADINKQIKNLATLDPGDLAARDALTQMKQVISRQFMKVYYIQRNRFSREQQGMAEGGLVERNLDEFSTADVPTMHPIIEKYLGGVQVAAMDPKRIGGGEGLVKRTATQPVEATGFGGLGGGGGGIGLPRGPQPIQEFQSSKTSLKQVPALLKNKLFKPGKRNLDIGGGAFNQGTEFLAAKGVANSVLDPYNRSEEHNEAVMAEFAENPADTVTVANVLNVIKEKGARTATIQQAHDLLQPGGTAYFSIYQGNSSGKGKKTTKGWQNNRKTKSYLKEVQAVFPDAVIKGGIILAPLPEAPLTATQVQEREREGMAEGGLVERPVQGMAHGGPATDHSVFGTLLPGAAARIEQDEYRLTAENWADISDNIQLKEGTINGFYLDDKGNWTAGTGHLVLSEDWDKYDVTITLPTGEEVSRDQFHKTESKTITVDGVEVTLPSLKAIGQIAVIDVEDGGTVHGEYRINSTPVGTRNAAGETIYPNLTDDIASWWATDFEEKTASAKEQAEEIMAAWKSDNFVGVPPQITNKRMVNILEALVDLNFNVGTSWHKDVGEKKGFTGVYDGLLTGNFTNAALNLKWRNIDPAIDDDAATVPVATPYAIENTARMNANMKLLEGVTTEAILATFRPPPKPELTPAPSLVRPTEASTRAGLTPLVQQRLNDAMQAVRQFEPAPEGMSAGEKYLLEYHRDNLRNETYLIGEDGRVSTVYVSGVTGPDGRIYNVPGYFNGQLHENEDEIKAQVEKIGWENYPAYATGEEANAAAQAFHEIIDQDANTPWVKEMLSAPAPAPFNLVPPSVMADAIQRDKPPIPGIQSKPRDIPPIPGIQSNLAKGGLVKRKYYSGAGYH